MTSKQKVFFGLALLGAAGVTVALFGLSSPPPEQTNDAVRRENGLQVIHIVAKGGYHPSRIAARAGEASRIDMETTGTYDCSVALRIPLLDYSGVLPPTGTTSVTIPPQPKGGTIAGVCSMGMYGFTIAFE